MIHYSNDSSMVRIDFFRTSGKWHCTESIKWDRYHSKDKEGNIELIHETFKRCLREQLGGRLSEMIAVCLDPHHEHSHPLMVFNW